MRFQAHEKEAFAARLSDGRAKAKLTREQVVGLSPSLTSVQLLYNYERARTAPESIEIIIDLERALELAPGTLCRMLGFSPLGRYPAELGVEDAIAADPRLDADAKAELMAMYRAVAR